MASASAASSVQSDSLPCAFRKSRVFSSEGKRLVVTPHSAPILQMVERSGTSSDATPSPVYSKMQFTLPFTPYRSSTVRITSLALTQLRNFPCKRISMTFGAMRWKGPPAMATATSRPPAPMAIMPSPPPVGVWLSLPSKVLPGLPKRSRWTWWQIPFPGREKMTPFAAATVCR
ncbi:hypothetical protein SDC9_195517 [bioreactor metagenome]|uniref:Uncharacterized protein n=1 Tax=bioreactor metagenome TaxID=1076179 RepID=A0A645IKQ9_9ZZZZ